MKTDKELIVLGLNKYRSNLIVEYKTLLGNLSEVSVPLEYRAWNNRLKELMVEFDEIENRLDILDPSRNDIPF